VLLELLVLAAPVELVAELVVEPLLESLLELDGAPWK